MFPPNLFNFNFLLPLVSINALLLLFHSSSDGIFYPGIVTIGGRQNSGRQLLTVPQSVSFVQ